MMFKLTNVSDSRTASGGTYAHVCLKDNNGDEIIWGCGCCGSPLVSSTWISEIAHVDDMFRFIKTLALDDVDLEVAKTDAAELMCSIAKFKELNDLKDVDDVEVSNPMSALDKYKELYGLKGEDLDGD